MSIIFNLRFPGQYYDKDSGLYYNHNRYYNPELGRYMEPDPIGLEGGLNPYAYAGNNPVMNVDPTGENPVLFAMGVGAGISGGIYTGKTLINSIRDDKKNGRGIRSNFANSFTWSELGQQMAIGAAFGGIGKAAFLAADVHVAKTVLPESASVGQKIANTVSNLATNKAREFATPAGAVITANMLTGTTSTNLMVNSYNEQRSMQQLNQQMNQQLLGQQSNNFRQQTYIPPRDLGQMPPITIYVGQGDIDRQIQLGVQQNLNNY